MSQPILSICIPTYNRDKYLHCLLGSLAHDIEQLTHSYEIVIADNGSTDDTEAVVAEYLPLLRIRYFKRDKNYGGYNNRYFVTQQAQGKLVLCVADDDALLLAQVNNIANQMMADPSIGIAYAPWYLHDLVRDKTMGTFYVQEEDCCLEKGDHTGLLSHLLKHSIFPEIYICRQEVLQAVQPRTNTLAYWAFVQAAEYLNCMRVLFSKQPFYLSITEYFNDEQREQAGLSEVEEAWDRYRGGLEYILSRIPADAVDEQQRTAYTLDIHRLIAERLSVALQTRLSKERDMIDCYYLASRLAGMGYPQHLPMSLYDISVRAALMFLCKDEVLLDGIEKLVCVGNFAESVQRFLQNKSSLPVTFTSSITPEVCMEEGVLVCVAGSILPMDPELLASKQPRLVGLEDLMKKFGA